MVSSLSRVAFHTAFRCFLLLCSWFIVMSLAENM